MGYYINYVVCKGNSENYCVYRSGRYYINYVVCKVVAVDLFALACVDIILTMWYVKDDSSKKDAKTEQSIILTMWYVKFILLVIPPSIPLVLY
ncbi:Uncharacterised protein [Clostridioides difficile]|nr:hypothetical protein BER38_001784 [Clostridioides difficile]SJQ09562.1 Uncharacterised protein [Clostridioides difficile]VFD09669.1 Uncharacterised protein [Clostridioides difficile]VFD72646.1 Uncharacterised protein [Clostridioides difficile]